MSTRRSPREETYHRSRRLSAVPEPFSLANQKLRGWLISRIDPRAHNVQDAIVDPHGPHPLDGDDLSPASAGLVSFVRWISPGRPFYVGQQPASCTLPRRRPETAAMQIAVKTARLHSDASQAGVRFPTAAAGQALRDGADQLRRPGLRHHWTDRHAAARRRPSQRRHHGDGCSSACSLGRDHEPISLSPTVGWCAGRLL